MPSRVRPWVLWVLVVSWLACGGPPKEVAEDEPLGVDEPSTSHAIEPLRIREVEDEGLARYFSKRVDVAGIQVGASAMTPDDKVMHVASVMAEYLDNDEDGVVDYPALVETMIERNALMIMFADFEELEASGLGDDHELRERYEMQDCEAHETAPQDGFDASIEEVHHLIMFGGYAVLHPETFGEERGSALADAMDLARASAAA